MSAGPKEIWKTFKQDMKQGNAKVKADYKRDVAAIKTEHLQEMDKVGEARKADTKRGWKLFGLVLSLPLFFFGLLLLVMAFFIFTSI